MSGFMEIQCAMTITGGTTSDQLVPLGTRCHLIGVWVARLLNDSEPVTFQDGGALSGVTRTCTTVSGSATVELDAGSTTGLTVGSSVHGGYGLIGGSTIETIVDSDTFTVSSPAFKSRSSNILQFGGGVTLFRMNFPAEGIESYSWAFPGGTGILFSDGIHYASTGVGGEPSQVTILYQGPRVSIVDPVPV